MKIGNIALKGMLVFGFLGSALFIILIVLGMLMAGLGFSCECYKVMSWSLIGIAVVSALILWVGSCFSNPDGEACQSVTKINK